MKGDARTFLGGRRMIRLSALALLAACFYLSASAQEKADDVALRVVKYEGLKDEILKNRGKVVLVDFWADFCKPCKDAFPHTVELHRKYESKGLAVVSVALDSLEENPTQVKDNVLRFLKKQKATFANLLLDETDAFWQKKFRMDGPPCAYVFSRQGKWTQLTAQELEDHPKNLERLIEDLLQEK
jgi:thiol-disulfide isomerase/thioredoxin